MMMRHGAVHSIPRKPSSKLSHRLAFLLLVLGILFFVQQSVIVVQHEMRYLLPSTHKLRESVSRGYSCDSYTGVLHIAHGDTEGAAGTIFFLFVLNQLIYADMHNLLPWVHLNTVSKYVFDEEVHGSPESVSFSMLTGMEISSDAQLQSLHPRYGLKNFTYPGSLVQTKFPLENAIVTVHGNGVWPTYFEPISSFDPLQSPCPDKPLLRLTQKQIIPELHIHCPWSVRSWRYAGLLKTLKKDELTYDEWFEPQRRRASAIVKKYYRFRPNIRELAQRANPAPQHCLAMHIRHSDKANGRRKIPVEAFLPYVQAYVEASTSPSVYLATDSQLVLDEIQKTWPAHIQRLIRSQGQGIVRSNSSEAVFRSGESHDRTNKEVLTDILAMSMCDFMLHGMSAVSEAAIYLNFQLHKRSVNLEDRAHVKPDEFLASVQSFMSEQEMKS